MKIEHNHSIDFYKCLFTLLIIIHHTEFFSWLKHGYLGVEFFFITSGYFLIQKFKKSSNSITALDYTKNRIIKLYPHYLFSFIVLFIVSSIFIDNFFNIDNILKAIPELLLIQNIGIFRGSINYPLWYLSVLIVGGYFIYYILIRHEYEFTHFIAPSIIILVYTFIVNNGSSLENWDTTFIFYIPFWRGIADICIGIIIYKISTHMEKFKKYSLLLNIFEIISFILFAYLLICDNNNDIYSIIFLPVLILSCFYEKSIANKLFNCNIWSELAKYTYAIYLNHSLFIHIFKLIVSKNIMYNISYIYVYLFIFLFILSLLIYSILTEKLVSKLKYILINTRK